MSFLRTLVATAIVSYHVGCITASGQSPSVVILQDTTDVVVNPGDMAEFSVVAQGDALSYYWYNRQGYAVGYAATLQIPNAKLADESEYRVAVRSGSTQVFSRWAKLTVRTPPSITVQPKSAQLRVGKSSYQLSVSAEGSWLQYQWRKGGVPISTLSPQFLVFGTVVASNLGEYDVVVSNEFGSVTSNLAVLSEAPPLTITEQPQNLEVVPGSNGTLEVTASGFGETRYQWFRYPRGYLSAPLSFERTFTPTPTFEPKQYVVEVSDNTDRISSIPVTVVSRMAPQVQEHPAWQVVQPAASAQFTVTATGTLPMTFQWRRDGMVIPNATSKSLSISSATSTNLGMYDVVITNAFGTVTSQRALLAIIGGKPIITEQPKSSVGYPTEGAHLFKVRAVANPPPTYQWYRNGVALAGETGNELYIFEPGPTAVGSYHVEVRSATAVRSEAALLGLVRGVGDDVIFRKGLGQSVEMSVTSYGQGLTYRWHRFTGQMPDTARTKVLNGGKTLFLSDLKSTDTADYLCDVSCSGNPSSMMRIGPFQLRVQEGPPELAGDIAPPAAIAGVSYSFQVPVTDVIGREAMSYKVTGLPAGLRFDASQVPLIYGRTSAVRPEPYPVKLTATNQAGSTTVTLLLRVQALPADWVGTYEGLVPRHAAHNNDLGGILSLRVSPLGAFSGSMIIGTRRQPFVGNVEVDSETQLPLATIYWDLGRMTLLLKLTPDSQSAVATLTNSDLPEPLEFNLRRSAAPLPIALLGQYNVAIQPGASSTNGPRGNGHLILKTNATGSAAWSGKLADGTAVSGTSAVSAGGIATLFALGHKNSSSFSGSLQLSPDKGDGIATWHKKRQPAFSSSYTDGFDIQSMTFFGAKYEKPAAGQLLLELVPGQKDNLAARIGTEAAPAAPTLHFTVLTNHVIKKATAVAPFVRAELVINSKTGMLTGSLVHTATSGGTPTTRSLKFSSIVIQRTDFTGALGFCVGPQISAAPSPQVRPDESLEITFSKN